MAKLTRRRWRCFHCDEVFTSFRCAKVHFGPDEGSTPACRLKGSDIHLIEHIRDQEAQLAEYRSEDTKLLRALWSMEADHRQALRREEERGYEKGLKDGMELGRAALSQPGDGR